MTILFLDIRGFTIDALILIRGFRNPLAVIKRPQCLNFDANW